MSNIGLEKTTLVHISPLIVLAMSFCVTGISMVGYLYYSDYVERQSVKDGDISTKFATQKDVTVYEITSKGTTLPMILPSQVPIINDYSDQKNNILSINDIFSALWIPLLIIGSYVLVHNDKNIVSKVRV